MIRRAAEKDIPDVARIYEHILDQEEAGEVHIGWVRGIYPTEQTAREALEKKELFVDDEDGAIVAAAKINQEQVPEYRDACWEYQVPDEQVMVLHTLVVDPASSGRGCGRRFVDFYETYARQHGCGFLRMDTNAVNERARRLYEKLGFREVGIVPCVFNGIEGVRLVCLEKKLTDDLPGIE